MIMIIKSQVEAYFQEGMMTMTAHYLIQYFTKTMVQDGLIHAVDSSDFDPHECNVIRRLIVSLNPRSVQRRGENNHEHYERPTVPRAIMRV